MISCHNRHTRCDIKPDDAEQLFVFEGFEAPDQNHVVEVEIDGEEKHENRDDDFNAHRVITAYAVAED